MFGHPMVEDCGVDPETGELPVVTIVTDNGGPFRSFRFEAFIALHPELHHVRTGVRTPGQNGSRERGFGTLKYERLFIDEIDDALMLAKHAEEYRIAYSQIRRHEAIAWNRPQEVHLGLAWPSPPSRPFKPRKSCQLLDAGQADLTAWTRLLGCAGDATVLAGCEPKALRYRFLHVPARLTNGQRRRRLRIPESWPWAAAVDAVSPTSPPSRNRPDRTSAHDPRNPENRSRQR